MGRAAIAKGLDLATELLVRRDEEATKLRMRAQELAQKFAYDQQLLEQRLAGQAAMIQQRAMTPARSNPMSEGEAQRISRGAVPGRPYPLRPQSNIVPLLSPTEDNPDRVVEHLQGMSGGMPSTAQGMEALQALISGGQTESPAAQVMTPPRRQPLPLLGAVPPQTSSGWSPGGAYTPPAPDMDPNDPQLVGDNGSTEGARIQTDDGKVWVVRNGQWVPEQ